MARDYVKEFCGKEGNRAFVEEEIPKVLMQLEERIEALEQNMKGHDSLLMRYQQELEAVLIAIATAIAKDE